MYKSDHIFPVLPNKYLINEDGKPTTPFNLQQVQNLQYRICVFIFFVCCTKLYCTCWDRGIKQSQNGFHGIFVGILQYQNWYTVYIPKKCKILSSYGVVFYESFSSALTYTPQPYIEAMDMRSVV